MGKYQEARGKSGPEAPTSRLHSGEGVLLGGFHVCFWSLSICTVKRSFAVLDGI